MARRRKYTTFDEARTKELQIDEIQVVSGIGDDIHFTAVPVSDPASCPVCHQTAIERKERKSHIFNDAIPVSPGVFKFIELTFEFSKFRCKNPECRHVFTPPISFADPSAKATYRFSEAIVKSVMRMSYRQLSESIPYSVTPQAIGGIFRNWYDEREAAHNKTAFGIRYTPSTFGIVTASSQNQSFTVFLDCDGDDISIMEVVPEVGTSAIAETLAKYDDGNIGHFIISCSQVFKEFLETYYPGIELVTPGWFLYDAALEDYLGIVSTVARYCAPSDQKKLYQGPQVVLPEKDREWVDGYLLNHKQLHVAYDQIVKLRLLLEGPWEYKDLFDWAELIPHAEDFPISIECVSFFREELLHGKLFEDNMPQRFYQRLRRFRNLTAEFEENTPEVLRSRILYVDMLRPPDQRDDGSGNPYLDRVCDSLKILMEKKPKTYNRRRK